MLLSSFEYQAFLFSLARGSALLAVAGRARLHSCARALATVSILRAIPVLRHAGLWQAHVARHHLITAHLLLGLLINVAFWCGVLLLAAHMRLVTALKAVLAILLEALAGWRHADLLEHFHVFAHLLLCLGVIFALRRGELFVGAHMLVVAAVVVAVAQAVLGNAWVVAHLLGFVFSLPAFKTSAAVIVAMALIRYIGALVVLGRWRWRWLLRGGWVFAVV